MNEALNKKTILKFG